MAIDFLFEWAKNGTISTVSQTEQEQGYIGEQVYYGDYNYMWNIYSKKINEMIQPINDFAVFTATAQWKDGNALSSDNFNDAINEIVSTLASGDALLKISGTEFFTQNRYLELDDAQSLESQLKNIADLADENGFYRATSYHDDEDIERVYTNQFYNSPGPMTFPYSKGNFWENNIPFEDAKDIAGITLNFDPELKDEVSFAILQRGNSGDSGEPLITYANSRVGYATSTIYRNNFETLDPSLSTARPWCIASKGHILYVLWYYLLADPAATEYKRFKVGAYVYNPNTGPNPLSLLSGFTSNLLLPTGGGDLYSHPKLQYIASDSIMGGDFLLVAGTWIQHDGAVTQPAIITKVDAVNGNLLDSGRGNMPSDVTESIHTGLMAVDSKRNDVYFATRIDGVPYLCSANLSDLTQPGSVTSSPISIGGLKSDIRNHISFLACDQENVYAMAYANNDSADPAGNQHIMYILNLEQNFLRLIYFGASSTIGPDALTLNTLVGGAHDGMNLWLVTNKMASNYPNVNVLATYAVKINLAKLGFDLNSGNAGYEGTYPVKRYTESFAALGSFYPDGLQNPLFRYPMYYNGRDLWMIDSDDQVDSDGLQRSYFRLARTALL